MILLRDRSHRLVVIVGGSGVGKDSVLTAWLASLPRAQAPHRARRTITRAAGDASEDHEPLDEAGFRAALADGAFAFAWCAHGLHYGVRRSELAPLAHGQWVVMNGSRGHLAELRASAPHAKVIEIVAPEVLRRARLAQRGREALLQRDERLNREAPGCAVDLRIHNDGELSGAVAQLDRWWRALHIANPATDIQLKG